MYKFILPALAVVLSTLGQGALANGGFGGSCKDGAIFKHANGQGWTLGCQCRKIDGSWHYTELPLVWAIHYDVYGVLRWEPPFGNNQGLSDCIEMLWSPGAGNVISAKCPNYYDIHLRYSTIPLNDRIGNNDGNLAY